MDWLDGLQSVVRPLTIGLTLVLLGPSHALADKVHEAGSVYTSTDFTKLNKPPRDPVGRGWDSARVHFDANGDGISDYFVAEQRYNDGQSAENATPSDFILYIGKKGSGYTRSDALLRGTGKGCIHPRKAVVNDFNSDGRHDVFVLCHGWDKPPFPGERNKIVLSQPDGTFAIRDAAKPKGFFHGGASADFNGDGHADIVLTNNFDSRSVKVWLGDGRGSFKIGTNGVPGPLKRQGGYFTVELPDVDGDGRFDLFTAGHEFEGVSTTVFLNDARAGFRSGKKITIPAVSGQGVVLDAVATGHKGNRKLWILRTSGGDGTFYQGFCVQVYEFETGRSGIAHCDPTKTWFPWLTTWSAGGRTYIGSESRRDRFSLAVD